MNLRYMIQQPGFNSLSGEIEFLSSIPQLDNDPASPAVGDAWVWRDTGGGAGSPYGLLLSLTKPGTVGTNYRFSYRTIEGTTIRVTMA